MKHKPMLLARLAFRSRDCKRSSIGLIGTHHGTGVTYTGLMLAFYLGGELGKRTAFVECNGHHDMGLIEEAYEWTSSQMNMFSFHNITCYKELSCEQLPSIYGDDYEALVFDFGIDLESNINEFLRCDKKIVLAGRAQWELIKLRNFHQRIRHITGSGSLIYLIRQTDDRTIHRLTAETGSIVMSIPEVADPVMPSRSINRFFAALLGC